MINGYAYAIIEGMEMGVANAIFAWHSPHFWFYEPIVNIKKEITKILNIMRTNVPEEWIVIEPVGGEAVGTKET